MATRKHTPTTKTKTPAGPHGWDTLLSKTIQRATLTRDPRLAGLRRAMTEGKSERILRQMGILSDKDIDREFPVNGR